jgi:hypothetical protein
MVTTCLYDDAHMGAAKIAINYSLDSAAKIAINSSITAWILLQRLTSIPQFHPAFCCKDCHQFVNYSLHSAAKIAINYSLDSTAKIAINSSIPPCIPPTTFLLIPLILPGEEYDVASDIHDHMETASIVKMIAPDR